MEGAYRMPALPAALTKLASALGCARPALAAGAMKNGAEKL